jgi:hypothetical protein
MIDMRDHLLHWLKEADAVLAVARDPKEIARLEAQRAELIRDLQLNDAHFELEHDRLFKVALEGSRSFEAAPDRRVGLAQKGFRATLDMVFLCARDGRPIPAWARSELFNIEGGLRYGQFKSWDDVFGRPVKKGAQLRAIQRRRELWLKVRLEVLKRQEAGRPIEPDMFDAVGEELGITGALAREVYYHSKKEDSENAADEAAAKEFLRQKGPPKGDFHEL